MTRIIWSPASVRDLEVIRDYVSASSSTYAGLLVSRILASVERLALFPESGRVVPEKGVVWLREVIVRPYRVVYRLRGAYVEVVTIFHAARLPPLLEASQRS